MGSLCFLCNADNEDSFLITGDTLFSNSIGRCDLFGGNETLIIRSLKALSTLDSKIKIYPGHGASCELETALANARYYVDF